MSTNGKNLWLEGHKEQFEDHMITDCVVDILRKCGKSPKEVATDMGMKVEKIRNWFYRRDRIYGCDLLRLFARYEFMRRGFAVSFNWADQNFEFKYNFWRI